MVRVWSPCACVASWSLFPQTRARTGGLWSQFFTSAFVHGRSVRHPRLRGLANAQCDYGSHSLLAVSLVGTLTTVGHRALGVGRHACAVSRLLPPVRVSTRAWSHIWEAREAQWEDVGVKMSLSPEYGSRLCGSGTLPSVAETSWTSAAEREASGITPPTLATGL